MELLQEIGQKIIQLCQEQKAQELDQLIDELVCYPNFDLSDIDTIFDWVAVELRDNHDVAAWLCSFMSGELASLPTDVFYPIGALSKLLLDLGFELFKDFTPQPNCQMIIINNQKYDFLSQETKEVIALAFSKIEKSIEVLKKDNQSMIDEFR